MTYDDAEQRDLAEALRARCCLQGTFRLRSGQISSTYFDKYQFEADPSLLGRVARRLASLVPPGTEVLAGLELGGVPIATALALETGLPAAFVRKQAKEYGTARLAEGTSVVGRRCLVVEDVVTTGGQIVLSTRDLRALGAVVDHALCVVDRSMGDVSRLTDAGLTLHALFTSAELGQ